MKDNTDYLKFCSKYPTVLDADYTMVVDDIEIPVVDVKLIKEQASIYKNIIIDWNKIQIVGSKQIITGMDNKVKALNVDKLLHDAISKAAIKNTILFGKKGIEFSDNEMIDSFKDGVKSDEAKEYWRNYFKQTNL